jgi:predicted small metal-binding protein
MGDEVREGQSALAAGEAAIESLTIALDHKWAADLDAYSSAGHQRHANILAIVWRYNLGGRFPMARLINCECGFVARGDTDDEVIDVIRGHMRSDHPALLDTVGREDLLGWISIE